MMKVIAANDSMNVKQFFELWPEWIGIVIGPVVFFLYVACRVIIYYLRFPSE